MVSILEKQDSIAYEIIPEVPGKIPHGIPRMNTPVWPGHNSIIVIQTTEEQEQKLIDKFRMYNETVLNNDELLSCWSWEMKPAL